MGRRLPLAWVLTIPFVSLSCAAVVIVGGLSLRNSQHAVNDLSDRLHLQVRERVSAGLVEYFNRPKQSAQLFANAFESQLLAKNDLRQIGHYAWQLRQSFSTSYVNYGLASGEFVGAGASRKGLTIAERSPALGWRYEEYATDAKGDRLQRVDTFPYDHRNEAWYQEAVRQNRPVWSKIYAWDGTPEFVSINYAIPLRNPAGQPIGAIGVDVLLDHISQLLENLKLHPDLKIAIVERNGDLVASSTGEALFSLRPTAQGPQLDRVAGANSTDPRLRAALAYLKTQGGLTAIHQATNQTFDFGGKPYLLWTSPWQDQGGLDWVVIASLPQSAFMERIEANRQTTILLCGLVVALAVFLGLLMARKLALPVRSLAEVAGKLSRGRLNFRADDSSVRELHDLSVAFNQMADALRHSLQALEETNQSLETRVQERTAALTKTLNDLQSTQAQLIQTEKMSGLGQMVAGIAHEINNPVAFIHGNLGILRQYVDELTDWSTFLEETKSLKPTDSSTQPVNTKSKLDFEELAFVLSDLPKLVNSMEEGTRRIQEIVLGLRNFSRLDQPDRKPANLNDGIESTLTILNHRLKRYGDREPVQIIKCYEDLPAVWCYPGQLNQAFMNLLGNAIDALDEAWAEGTIGDRTPTISLRTRAISLANHSANRGSGLTNSGLADASPTNGKPESVLESCPTSEATHVEVTIGDNGTGIPDHIRDRMFNPFFTTKPVGKGTGLGLAIAYQIVVDRHGGQVICDSTVGEGTTFTIRLPLGAPSSDPLELGPSSATDTEEIEE